MHRRQMLTSVAAASAGLIAASALGSVSARAAAQDMGDAEMKHAKETGMVGSLSLATSRVAVEKASNEWVKKFATFEVAEQETIADILMSMKADPSAAEGALKKPSDADVEARSTLATRTC